MTAQNHVKRALRSFRSNKGMLVIGWLLFGIMAATNGLLLRQNDRLTTRLTQADGDILPAQLGNLTGVGLDGQVRQIRFDSGRSTLIFAFSRGCQYCQASMPHWRTLAAKVDRSRWEIVWVSRDSIASAGAFAQSHGINDLVLADVPYRLYQQLGLSKVPRTVLLSPDGRLVTSVLGVMDANRVENLSRFFIRPSALR